MARRASQKRRHELNNIHQRQSLTSAEQQAVERGIARDLAREAARANAVDTSKLGFVKNWQECTAVAVNPHHNKSWNSYAHVANERLKRVEYNTGVKTADVVPNFKPKANDVQRALNNGMTIYTDLSLKK